MRQGPFPAGRAQAAATPPPPRIGRSRKLRQRLARISSRFHDAFLLSIGLIISLGVVVGYEAIKPPPQRLTQRDINAAVGRAMASVTPPPSYAVKVYETIRPSLVLVRAILPMSTPTSTATANAESSTEEAMGTGVVIDDSGTILSSLHVVKDALSVRVRFADGTEAEAIAIVRQPDKDLVVLRPSVIPDDLVPATLAAADGLQIGDEVVAVGHPFGMSDSRSAGVVSGLHRQFTAQNTDQVLRDLIQFDAAVNPGNSGGPLLDRDGEVVGIVTGLLNPSDQDVFIGIGFAVPIEAAAGAAGSPAY